MKNIFCFIFLFLGYGVTKAQITPTAATAAPSTQTVNPVPSGYTPGNSANYVRAWSPLRPLTLESDVTSVSRTVDEVNKATQYTDGLGRPLQVVNWQASPKNISGQSFDMVMPVVYDAMGREQFKYDPYIAGSNTGTLNTDPFTAQAAFAAGQYPGEQFYYSQTTYETSPLSRVTKTAAPGNSWAGSDRGVSILYDLNVVSEVVNWKVSGTTFSADGYYAAGQLYRNITTDEKGKRTVEYKDKDNRIVLKKVETGNSPDPASYNGWLCTHYVYDDAGLLRFVLQPKLVEWEVTNSFATPAQTLMDELSFSYQYDERNRMMIKKVPGAGEVWMVYDTRDRLVMTQDANQRTLGKWLVTTYDNLNRPVATGLLTDGNNRNYHHDQAYNSTTYPYTGGGNYELLTQTFYDNYSWTAGVSGITGNFNTTFTSSGDYIGSYGTAPFYAEQVTPTAGVTTNLPTGTKIKVLGTNSFLYTVTFYDNKGRAIQKQTTNYAGGTDIATIQYDFGNKVLRTHQIHNNPSATPTSITVVTATAYDHQGRVLTVQKKLDNEAWKTIAQNQYDALGQLQTKKLGTDPNTGLPLETLDYTYNIRGWLTGINRGLANPQVYTTEASNQNTRWFGMQLSYDYGFSQNQYNGNIAGTVWSTKGSGEQRAYGYDYDAANRLLKGDFTQLNKSTSSWGADAIANFNVRMGSDGSNNGTAYDANGNIQRMQQWGIRGITQAQIDDLTYNYANGFYSNKLTKVTDAYSDPATTLGDFKDGTNTGDDYAYDGNGNMVLDNNKTISSIVYNYLNLPQTITVTGKGTISYTYDAAGNKLQKITDEPASGINGGVAKNTHTDYVGGFVYQSSINNPTTLQYFGQEEGRIRRLAAPVNGSNYAFDYFIKDHLGNTRLVLTDEVKANFYPAATVEGDINNASSAAYIENQFYTIDPARITPTPPGAQSYANNNGIANNNPNVSPALANTTTAQSYRLNGAGGGQTGLGITLHVMAGDKIDIFGKSYYEDNNSNDNLRNSLATSSILNGLLGGPTGTATAGHAGVTAGQLGGMSDMTTAVTSFLTSNGGTRLSTFSSVPRAYINYIVFDEHFKYVSGNISPVGSVGVVKDHHGDATLQGISIPKNGYLYVYCSNESPVNVYFDNLQIVHTQGPLTEETHYYPFGLTMAGISSKTADGLENKMKYNGGSELQNKEFSDGSGLEMYATELRSLDPQIGRWWQIDSKPTDMVSPYASMSNNPIRYSDPLGDTAALFRPDGTFLKFQDDGKKEFSGVYYHKSTVTSAYEKDGVKYEVRSYSEGQTFKFNDAASDILAIKNGVASGGTVGITRVEIMSDAKVESQIEKSGVKSLEAQTSPISFANTQGRQGYMDYGVKGITSGDLKTNTFYVRENIAYNVGDIGNYLWGRGMAELGISLGVASTGAHVNNMVNGRGDKTPLYDFGQGTYGSPGFFDSIDDQRAIQRGYQSSPKGVMLQKQEWKNWPKYNPK
ncbi:DUF6443 domain-containing protein [Chitinophagaceae bacterium LWZ2-11]